jgi:hypothetical protein
MPFNPSYDIAEYMPLDAYTPSEPKTLLQRFDNYQIYDLYTLETIYAKNRTEWKPKVFYNSNSTFFTTFLVKEIINQVTPISNRLFSVQKYAPTAITFNMYNLIERCSAYQFPSHVTGRYGTSWRSAVPSEYSLDNVFLFVGGNVETSGSSYEFYTIVPEILPPLPPIFLDLAIGYSLDTRIKTDLIKFTAPKNEQITVSYYRRNHLEGIDNLTSFDWNTFSLELIAGKTYTIDCKGIVLGTLNVSSQDIIENIVESEPVLNTYPQIYYLIDGDISAFSDWIEIYQSNIDSMVDIPAYPTEYISNGVVPGISYQSQYTVPVFFSRTEWISQPSKISRIAANNNYWNNDSTNYADINYLEGGFNNFFFFLINRQTAYNLHIKEQLDGSIGELNMDSIRTIEIHAALNAGKWGINTDDPTKTRKDDLGWRIQRICEVLGIRVGTDGKFDPVKEKKIVRQVISAKEKLDAEKVGVNNFGDGGMVVKRINNRFNGDKIESDQCVIIHDLLQLIQEYHEQHNLAIGLQESSAIEIKDPKDKEGKNRARFDNQLGLLLEMFNLLSSANEMTRANLISSLITQSQTNEVIAGLGLPSVTKTIPIEIDKKVSQVPYKGIAAHRSISQEIATCTYNVGIVLGQLL